MAEQYSIVWVCLSVYVYVHMCMCGFTYTHTHTHTHFICSSVDGYLGCFYILAIVSSATVRIGLHVSFQVRAFIFSGYRGRSRIAVSYGNYFQFFKKSPYYSPQWLHQFTFSPKVQEGSLFSTSSPAFTICRIFDDSYSDWCEVIQHCSFDLHFSNNQQR